jgi:hypothetical protein
LRDRVAHWIQGAIALQVQTSLREIQDCPTTKAVQPSLEPIPSIREIPVNFVKKETGVFYVSAIAFRLAKQWQKSAAEIAQSLIESIVQLHPANNSKAKVHSFAAVGQNFIPTANLQGWIFFEVTNQGLAQWLQDRICYVHEIDKFSSSEVNLEQNPQKPLRISTGSVGRGSNFTEPKNPTRNSTEMFEAQFLHARCCSILRLGMQENLIQFDRTLLPNPQSNDLSQPLSHDLSQPLSQPLSDPLISPCEFRITGPQPLPWLTEQGSLRLQHPAEKRLVSQLCTAWDQIAQADFELSPEQSWKLIRGTIPAFQCFYAECPIFGEERRREEAIAQIRLGLVALTRDLLHYLLEHPLYIIAPTEL